MKMRFLCLLVCLLMVFPMVLSGCASSSETDTEETTEATSTKTSNKAMTITLYTITDKSTTDEDKARIQSAINNITEAEFNTHVLLRMYTEDEYDAAIAEKIETIDAQLLAAEEAAAAKKAAEKAAKEAAKTAGETTTTAKADTTESTEETDETIINSYGLEETVYPAENGTQLDIMLVRGFDNISQYASDGVLSSLDEQLSIGSKILKQYIHPTFLSAAKINGKTVAIPNNHVVGEYQYLLVNKELVDKYYYDPDSFTSLLDLNDFFNDVIKYEPEYTALMNEPESEITYFTSEESLIGASVAKQTTAGTAAVPKNLLSVTSYINTFKMMLDLKSNNAIGGDGAYIGDGNKYAAAVITGDPTTPELYKDQYYVSVYKYPTATNENVYSGMYAVSKYAADVSRCMEVVNLFTTNSEFINLMQYGVDGVDYDINEATGYVESKSTYSMNSDYTGNQFLMLQSSDMTDLQLKLSDDNWALAKTQNLDMVYNPYLGFSLSYLDKEGEKLLSSELTIDEIMKGVVDSSAGYLEQIANFKEYDEESEEPYLVRVNGEIETRTRTVTKTITVDDFISGLIKEANADIYIAACLNAKDENSPISQYNTWYAATYPATETAS